MAENDQSTRELDVTNALQELRNTFAGAINSEELVSCVKEIMRLENFKVTPVQGKNTCFKANVQCDLQTEEDVLKFTKSYHEVTTETLRKLTPRDVTTKHTLKPR